MTDVSLSFPLPHVETQSYVYDGFYKVREDKLRLGEGRHYNYYTVVGQDNAVMVIAEEESGKLIINHEYRHPTRQILLSLPGGTLEAGESPLKGALRELQEETGYSSEKLSLLGTAYPIPGMYPQRIHYVLAQNCRKTTDPNLEIAEYIQTELLYLSHLQEKIRAGHPVDGILCSALFFYQQHQLSK